MISILQILITIFALFAFTRVILRLKKQQISVSEFIFWSIVWLAIITVALVPGIFYNIAQISGVESSINLLVYVSIVVLLYLVFRLYVKFDNMEQKQAKLIREISIQYSEHNKEKTTKKKVKK